MTKKRLLVVSGLLVALIGIGLGVAALIPEGPGVTKANFDRIKKGTTLSEVEEILGREHIFGRGPGILENILARIPRPRPKIDGDVIGGRWDAADGAWAGIVFVDGMVAAKHWSGSDETFLAKIRHSFHLR